MEEDSAHLRTCCPLTEKNLPLAISRLGGDMGGDKPEEEAGVEQDKLSVGRKQTLAQ